MARAVAIVGPGAVGSVLAARFAAAGIEVRLLGRTPSADARLARCGILLRGPAGRSTRIRSGLRPARGPGPRPPLSAAFFCVKSADASAAIASASPLLGPRTPVVALQNGLAHAPLFRRAFGPERTVIGSCYIAADRPSPGRAAHNGGRRILLGANPRNAASAQAVRALLAKAGWSVRLEAAEDRMLWTKLAYNASVNLLGAAGALPNGELARDPALREILLKAIAEATAAARRAGHPPLHSDLARRILLGCRRTRFQRNSMLQDLAAGRRTEAGMILGPILAAGSPAPILRTLLRVIERLERRPSGGSRR